MKASYRPAILNIYIGYANNGLPDYTASQVAYAQRHGYDYIQVTENTLPDEKPTWMKHVAAQTLIRDRPCLLIIDSDAEFQDDCPPFDRLVRQNRGADLFLALGRSYRPNAGVIMLRGGSASIAPLFIATLLDQRDQPLPEQDRAPEGGDNGHLINLLRQPQFKSRLFVLPLIWNNTVKPTDWDFVRHYTGPMRGYSPKSVPSAC